MFTFFCHFVKSEVARSVVPLPVLLPELAIFINSLSFASFDIWIWSKVWGCVSVGYILDHHLSVRTLDALSRCPMTSFINRWCWISPLMFNSLLNSFLASQWAIELDHGYFYHVNFWGSLLDWDFGLSPIICLFHNLVNCFILYNNIIIIFVLNG